MIDSDSDSKCRDWKSAQWTSHCVDFCETNLHVSYASCWFNYVNFLYKGLERHFENPLKTPRFLPLQTTLMSLSNSFEETTNAPAAATPAAAISDVGTTPTTFSALISVIFGPAAAGVAIALSRFNLERIFVSRRNFSHTCDLNWLIYPFFNF